MKKHEIGRILTHLVVELLSENFARPTDRPCAARPSAPRAKTLHDRPTDRALARPSAPRAETLHDRPTDRALRAARPSAPRAETI